MIKQARIIINVILNNIIKSLSKAMVTMSNLDMIQYRNIALAHFNDLQGIEKHILLMTRQQTKVVEQAREETVCNDFAKAKQLIINNLDKRGSKK